MQKIEGKKALLEFISGFSMNFWYLLKKVQRQLKLSLESLPPMMNIPNPFGRWASEEKNRKRCV